MNQLILTLLITNTFIFFMINHPMSMGLIILLQTFLTCMIMSWMSKTFWFSYILFLIFIGGLLILFIYMASIASNEKFNFSFNFFFKINLIYFFTLIYLIMDKYFLDFYFFNNESNIMTNFSNLIKENFLSHSNMYNYPNNLIIMFLIIYLLLNLIIIVKITNIFYGPLRTKN